MVTEFNEAFCLRNIIVHVSVLHYKKARFYYMSSHKSKGVML